MVRTYPIFLCHRRFCELQMNSLAHLSCHSCGEPYRFQPSPVFYSKIYDALLFSNDPAPQGTEQAFRDEILPSALRGVAAVDSELERLGAAIALITAERERLQAERSRLETMAVRSRAVLSPLRLFPVECMTEIFRWYCDDKEDFVFDTSKGPWALSHVCRFWRDIVLGNPAFWSYFNFNGHEASPYPRGWRKLFTARIERTSNHPISFHLSAVATEDEFSEGDYSHEDHEIRLTHRRCWKRLGEHSARWKHVSLKVGWFILKNLRSVVGGLPLLESIAIDLSEAEDFPSRGATLDVLQTAPLLHTVDLKAGDDLVLRLPLLQLRTARVRHWNDTSTIKDASAFLSGCPGLESLTVDHDDWGDTEDGPQIEVISTSLLYLSIVPFDNQLTAGIRTPHLQELHVHYLEDMCWLREFLKRLRCQQLKRLHLHAFLNACDFTDSIRPAMEMLPALEEVHILPQRRTEYEDSDDAKLGEVEEGARQGAFDDFLDFLEDGEFSKIEEKLPYLRLLRIDLGRPSWLVSRRQTYDTVTNKYVLYVVCF